MDAPPNNVTPVEQQSESQETTPNTIPVKQTTVPTVPEQESPQKIKSIQTIHPEEVLKEVEQAQNSQNNK